MHVTLAETGRIEKPEHADQVLVVDARGFRPEGSTPRRF